MIADQFTYAFINLYEYKALKILKDRVDCTLNEFGSKGWIPKCLKDATDTNCFLVVLERKIGNNELME